MLKFVILKISGSYGYSWYGGGYDYALAINGEGTVLNNAVATEAIQRKADLYDLLNQNSAFWRVESQKVIVYLGK